MKCIAIDAFSNQTGTIDQTTPSLHIALPIFGSAGANATISCPATPTFTAPTASDACNSATVQLVSDITTQGSCAGTYSETRTWRAVDACGNQSGTVAQTVTVKIGRASCRERADTNATISCPDNQTFTAPTASD